MKLQQLITETSDYEDIDKISKELHGEIIEFYKTKSIRQLLDYTQVIKMNSGREMAKKIKENNLKIIIHLEKSDEVKKYASTDKKEPRYFFITFSNPKEPARMDSIAHELTHIFDYIKAWPKSLHKDDNYKNYYGNKDRQYEINKAYMEYAKSFSKEKREYIQNLYIPYFKTYTEFNARLTNLLRKINIDKHITDSYKNILNALEIPTTDKYLSDKELKRMILSRLHREGIVPNYMKS